MADSLRVAPEERRLTTPASEAETEPTLSSAPGFRRFLKIAAEKAKIRHRLGLGGLDIASGRSYLVDQVVGRACQLAAEESDLATRAVLKDGCAVVALGGYGRRELAPFSDVDLLFLHDEGSWGAGRPFVERVLVMLWDAGLTVGHSVRDVGECVAIALEDLHARSALSEARLVTGNARLFSRLESALDESVFGSARRQEGFLEALRQAREARRARFGRTVCLQEPHVKESAGGLRDAHTIAWAGRVRFGARGLAALAAAGQLSPDEHERVRRAYDFLSRVRNEAHFMCGRRADLLLRDLQPAMAVHLGYHDRRDRHASEAFMRDYYQRAHDLHGVCEAFLARAAVPPPRRLLRPRWPRSRRGPFEIAAGRMSLALPEPGFPDTPVAAARAFVVAQEQGVALDDRLRLAIRARLGDVDARFRGSEEAREALLAMLGRRGTVGPALRAMHETGFLGRLLPEFARVTFMVQHDRSHRFTVDEHTLAAVEALDELARGSDPARMRAVLARLDDAAPLYLGVLLHDVGKGQGEGHAARGARIAERVCLRLQMPGRVGSDVAFLVRNHLLMMHVSQRRDLSEPRVVEAFAATVRTPRRLDMLMLLTWADAYSVGPGVWTEWKGSLLWELYAKAHARLAGAAPLAVMEPARSRDGLVRALGPEFPASVVERHLALMPERYQRELTPARLRRHLRLVRWLAARAVALFWRPAGHHTELTVCAADRPGLLAAIAGALTSAGIDILSVDAYTREDGVVLDTFRLSSLGGDQPVGPDRWRRIEASLTAAVEGRMDVGEAVEKGRGQARPRSRARRRASPVVLIDSEASEGSTVVEVRADDELGLMYVITHTLAGLDLNISFATIATEKSRALDVFYVTDADGDKLAPERAAEVERALHDALRTFPRGAGAACPAGS